MIEVILCTHTIHVTLNHPLQYSPEDAPGSEWAEPAPFYAFTFQTALESEVLVVQPCDLGSGIVTKVSSLYTTSKHVPQGYSRSLGASE